PALQASNEARRIPAITAARLHLAIEVVDQPRDRQISAVRSGLIETNAQVLTHPIHGETEVELAGVHGPPAVFHLPRLRGALRDRRDQRLDVEAGTFPEVDRFGEALNNAGDGNLIGHFRQLTRSRRTHAANAARMAFDHRLGMSEGGYIAARHHGKRAGFGSRLTT